MTHFKSDRPHGRLFAKYGLRIEAVPKDDAEVELIAVLLDALGIEESLACLAQRIETAVSSVRVEMDE